MPYVLERYGKSSEKKLAELADLVGIDGDSNEAKARNFIDSLRAWNRSFGIPENLEMLKEEDFGTIIKRALAEANPTYPVPKIWGTAQLSQLLLAMRSPPANG